MKNNIKIANGHSMPNKSKDIEDLKVKCFFWASIALAAVTLFVFYQAVNFPFINYDDEVYITGNKSILRGFSWKILKWAFITHTNGDWQPLTWISFLMTRQLFGINASAYHAANIVWHMLNTVLVFWVFRKMTEKFWASFFLAAFFAIHPLRVESVVWISELKDVLSGFFWWVTVSFYAVWVIEKKKAYKFLSIGAYSLAILSKPIVVSLPLMLLLLDYWPLGRFRDKRSFFSLVREKIPFFLLAVIPAIMVIRANIITKSILALDEIPLLLRVSNAIISYGVYIQKTFFPFSLAIFYPFPHAEARSLLMTSFYLLALGVISFIVWKERKRAPYLLVGWVWYLITLLPVIGIMRLTYQAMADRYTYLPHIGLGIMIIWSLMNVPQNNFKRSSVIFGGCLLVLFSAVSMKQVTYWRSPLTLNEHAAKVVPDNYVAYGNLGYFYFKEKNFDKSLEYYQKSIKLQPSLEKLIAMGSIYGEQKKFGDAEMILKRALQMYPHSAEAYHNLGIVYLLTGEDPKAEESFLEAARLDKQFWMPRKAFLARYYLEKGEVDKAEPIVRRLYARHPRDGKSNYLMGKFEERKGNKKEAFDFYEKAAYAIIPSKRAVDRLSITWLNAGEFPRMENLFQYLLKKEPENIDFRLNLANALLAQGKNKEALNEAEKVLRLNPDMKDALELKAQISKLFKEDPGSNSAVIVTSGAHINTADELRDLFEIFGEHTGTAR